MAKRSRLMRMGWRKRALPAAAGLIVLVLTAAIHYYNPLSLNRFGDQLMDQFQRWEPREYQDVGVRVVDIDEDSIDRIGQWPWPRTQIAEMTQRMFEAGAGGVAYDIVFSEADRTSPENLRPTLIKGGATEEVLAGLEQYRPHDEVFGEKLGVLSELGGAVIMGYFFEYFEGPDMQPKRLYGPSSAGEVPVQALPRYVSVTDSIPVINDNAYDAGFVSTPKDPDGIVRKAALLAYLDTGTPADDPFAILDVYPSLSLAMYRFFLEATADTTAKVRDARGYRIETSTGSGEIGANVSQIAGIRFGEKLVPTTAKGELLVHFTEGRENRVIPAWKLLDPDVSIEELEKDFLLKMTDADGNESYRPTLVYVGTGAQGLYDLVATPLEPTLPGVLVHAQATEQMLLGHFLTKPDWAPGVRLLSLLLGGLILILIVPIAGPLRSGLVAVLIIGGLFFVSWELYVNQRTLFDPVYPAIALGLVYLITSTSSFILTEAEKSHINGAFSRYLSPDMVAKIADDPGSLELGGENRDMTILFSDIRGFSKISEGMTSAELTSFLNRYLTPMTQILMSHKATVDKYIGDAVMAFWNAPLDDPEHHRNAALSALEMMDRLAEMNAARSNPQAPESEKLPVETTIGIGLFSGDCSVGNMGSDQRFDYSVLGDVVNTSSRLEGMTKQYGVGILVGDSTAEHLGEFALIELDRAKAVGKDSWLTIFALVGDEQVANDPAFAKLLELQSKFLATYREQNFEEALTMIGELSRLGAGFGLGKHYTIMQERIEAYLVDPPPQDWEGVYVLRQK
ncbi:CHASE2 domain-containing protein [Parvularcula marina]|uniref:Adenylate/guanylate cyclase domain-containing protein n=1 Tax=Parvularcula marina TaxID=2292771 RepID=A0A371RJI9_9PROT|nr:adenylate/guanylate cyclase domain-containing protein [Parvularcula marina]RFB05586.1 adenylate/guanylate cyclase domain-containing protein [Parvularcula marina]